MYNKKKILITPQDPWPGDASIGESIFQGDFNLSNKKKEILYELRQILWAFRKSTWDSNILKSNQIETTEKEKIY